MGHGDPANLGWAWPFYIGAQAFAVGTLRRISRSRVTGESVTALYLTGDGG